MEIRASLHVSIVSCVVAIVVIYKFDHNSNLLKSLLSMPGRTVQWAAANMNLFYND